MQRSRRPSAVASLGSFDGIRFIVPRCLLVCLVAATLVACGGHPVITVTNRSNMTLENLVVSGSGFTHNIASLAAGAQSSFSPRSRGDSGIRLAFDALGKRHSTPEKGYFEAAGGYRVSVFIDADFKVTVNSTLK